MYQLTPAQRAIRQSAVAGAITALAAIAGGTYQYALGYGLNIPALLLFLAPFVTGQALTLWHTLASNPQFAQAETDTLKNLPAEIAALPDSLRGLHGKFDTLLDYLTRRAAPPVASAPAAPAAQIAPTGIANMAAAQPWQITNRVTPLATGTTAGAPDGPQQAFPEPQFFPSSFTASVPAVTPGQS